MSRLRGAQQAEKEDRSSNEKESKMKAERLEFQTFNSEQSQARWQVTGYSLRLKKASSQNG
eukprot:1161211-Pelagomonas_calceolata.AAC.2